MLRRNKTDVEKEDYIWRRKIYFFRGEQNLERKMRNIFGDRKQVFFAGERINSRGKGCIFGHGKYVFVEEKNNREGKGGSVARGRSIQMIICKRLVNPDDHLQEAGQS